MKKPKIHLICNAHLDPVWQWRWPEGAAEAIATFQNAVDIIHDQKEFIFNHNEAVLYQWIKKYDPLLFKEIKNLVKRKRWFISGGWYLQPDCNMPGTESLIRQILIGRKFFKEEFGVEPIVAYNFDSFGHSGGLPQILNLTGYKMYIHMRPQEPDLKLPSDLYRWKGIDGSEILAYRTKVGFYHTERTHPERIDDRLNEAIEYALKINRDTGLFWGLGNHGGGATREDLEIIDEYRKKENRVEILHSTPDNLYNSLKKYSKDAPLFKGDLQRVNTGCYISVSRLKRGMQKSLTQIVQTEALRTAAWWKYGLNYPVENFEKIWKDHIFNDFHDILPGSGIEEVEKDALQLYGKISVELEREILSAAVEYNKNSNMENPYIPVTILNANPSLTKVPVDLECMIDYRPKWSGEWYLKLFKPDGAEVPLQEEPSEAYLPFNNWRRKISFNADLESIGATNYRIELCEGKSIQVKSEPKLKYRFDEGLISNIDAGEGRECLTGQLFKPYVVNDFADSWGTDTWSYKNIIGEFFLFDMPRVIQTGPIRNITEATFIFNQSKIIMHTIDYGEFPFIEFKLRIHWNEERKRLKLGIPSVFNNSEVLCEIPGGAIKRPADGEEHVQNRWFILSGQIDGKDTGLAVINNGQYGIDYQNGEIGLSVLRSAAYCHFKDFEIGNSQYRKYMDQGIHEIRLLVTAGDLETVRNSVSGLADYISSPPFAIAHLPIGKSQSKRAGKITSNNLLDINQKNIRLLALKASDDGKALILRTQETLGMETKAKICINRPAKEINLNFKPFEIKTIRIEKDGKWRPVGILEKS